MCADKRMWLCFWALKTLHTPQANVVVRSQVLRETATSWWKRLAPGEPLGQFGGGGRGASQCGCDLPLAMLVDWLVGFGIEFGFVLCDWFESGCLGQPFLLKAVVKIVVEISLILCFHLHKTGLFEAHKHRHKYHKKNSNQLAHQGEGGNN